MLFLYTELADYFLNSCKVASEQIDVFIIRWPVAQEAPFKFTNQISNVTILNKSELIGERLLSTCEKINPHLVVCSGWIDREYLRVVRTLKGKGIASIMTMDNHWNGSVKQHLGRVLSPFTLHNRFSHIWVPGEPQKRYAQKLGFKTSQILTGFYAANTTAFTQAFALAKDEKARQYPKVFLYVGRYVKHKGIFDLWEAFLEYKKQGGTWELWCAGTGDQWENRVEAEGIKHLGFVQPNELPQLTSQVGAFILPSYFEPWGVAVQEMAAAGLPLLLSDKVGSRSEFLQNDKNGFPFESGNVEQLAERMLKLEKMPANELLKMGEKSIELASSISQTQWVENLIKLIS